MNMINYIWMVTRRSITEMYLVIRCPSCSTFTYVDQYQKWRLCPVCSEIIPVKKAQAYVKVKNHYQADAIISKLEDYLTNENKKDLSPEEKKELATAYVSWVRRSVPLK